jgi:hypothetical protein
MPEDLKNYEGLFPSYYDNLYDQTLNPFEPGALPDIDGFLQSISESVLGRRLNHEKLRDLKMDLSAKGYLHRNLGDPIITEEATKFLKRLKMAQKLARICHKI